MRRLRVRMKLRVWQAVLAAMVMAMPLGLTGCGAFFVCAKASCTTSSSSTSGNYAYVSNSTTGITYINGYVISSGTLVAATGSPYSVSYTPSAMVVSESNKFLYVGSNTGVTGTGNSSIYGYTIGTGGALTILNSGNALITSQVAAMDVSPDGQWLLVLTIYDGVNYPTLTTYGINASTGLLTFASTQTCVPVTGQIPTGFAVKISPNATYVAVALGAGGIATYPFTTSNGALGAESLVGLNLTVPTVNDVAIDANNYLYAATTGAVYSFAATSTGVLSTTATGYTTGTTIPSGVAVDGTSYVYGASTTSTASNVYAFTNAGSGKLTAISSVAGPTSVRKLAVDSSAKYLLAAGVNSSSGLEMFSIGSTGALTLTSSAATGTTTNSQTYLALTH